MKIFFIAGFIFLSIFSCSSQTQIVGTIPNDGVLLEKGWKFHAGDDPQYAKPDFDDEGWQTIDPTKDIYDLLELRKGIVWFRLNFILKMK
jgi:hypothetical protein